MQSTVRFYTESNKTHGSMEPFMQTEKYEHIYVAIEFSMTEMIY